MTPPLSHFWHLTQQMTHCLTNHAYESAYSSPYSAADSSSLCLLIPAYALLCDCLQSPQLLTHFCLLFLLIHLLTDQLHCLLISLLIAYSYMLTPLLTDRLQSPYCCLTNLCFFYKSCLLSPHVYKLHWQPCKKSNYPPASKTSLSLYSALSGRIRQPISSL